MEQLERRKIKIVPEKTIEEMLFDASNLREEWWDRWKHQTVALGVFVTQEVLEDDLYG